jgi:hypothetical protein
MSDKKEEPANNEKLDDFRVAAQKNLEEIKVVRQQIEDQSKAAELAHKKAQEEAAIVAQIKIKSEEQLIATEISRKKADDDASYANQAKVNSEEHSKATAVFKGTAEADINSIATNKQKSDELLAALTRGKVDIDADKEAINECRKEVGEASEELLKSSQTGASLLKEVTEAKDSSVTLLTEIEEKRDAVIEANNLTKTAKVEAQASAVKAKELNDEILELHTSTTEQSAEIGDLLTNAKADKESHSKILAHLEKSDGIATGYEGRIEKSLKELEALIVKATGLLPGFASASLAHSFNDEKKRFNLPQKRWLKIFIWCIVGLGVVALPSFIVAIIGAMYGTKPDDWGLIFRSMAMRLPIVIPLVWLAILAGRNYMSAVRLEEDYAYKEALSKAFEGYKREMKDIPLEDVTKNPSPLNTLCVNVLKAIAERPGRIYDGKNNDMTLLNETIAVANEIRKKHIANS